MADTLPSVTADRGPYPPRAVVRASGTVEELDGAAGKRILLREARLVRYASALARSDRAEATFFFQGRDGGWLRVRLERLEGRGDEEPRALVSLFPGPLPSGLTARELDVLTLMAGGLQNREIAKRLGTSARTISSHVEHILAKLGQRTRAGAAALAIERGMLRLPLPDGADGLDALTIGTLERLAGEPPDRPPRPAHGGLLRGRRPLLIGSALPLTGPSGPDGKEMLNGATLAIEEINSLGGVGGRRIEHLVVDTDIFSVDGVRNAIERLVAAEVDAITVGYVFVGEDTLELAADYGAPYLHATTCQLQLDQVRKDPRRYGFVFQVCPTEVHYGPGFVRFLDRLVGAGTWRPHGRDLMVVETPVVGGQIAIEPTFAAAERLGWRISSVVRVPELGADWPSVVDAIHREDPAAILIADFVVGELASFQRAFAERPTEALVYALYTPSIPEFLRAAGPAAEGLLWSTVTGTYGDPIGDAFAARYLRRFGRPPGRSHAGIAYDEVRLLAQAWATVDNPRDFAAVSERLRRTVYRGVNGAYFFDNDGQGGLSYPDMTADPSIAQAHLVLQVQDGRHRVLDPPPYVEASFRPPSWWKVLLPA
ncbi:MAG TPA: ABC transporter substrate-binding protein [Actinomycetota bacterium]|nr:ABC transporter substrate-binding protein [Actinomycetota bacterium]